MSPDDPLRQVVTAGPRGSRLQALAQVPHALDAAALATLGKLAGDRTEDAVVRAAVIVHLAKRGQPAQAEADPPPAVRSALTRAAEVLHAQTLVAGYEAGKAPEPLARPEVAAAPADGAPIEVFAVADPDVRRIAAAAAPSLRASPHVVGLRCGRSELALLSTAARLDPAALLRAPGRVGQVAVHHTAERDAWTVPFDVLTEPAGDAIHVAVLDERGRTRFAGEARRAAAGLAFTVQAVTAPGVAPVSIAGTVTAGVVTITGARSGAKAPPSRAPARS